LVGNSQWIGHTDVVASRHFLWHQQLGKTSKGSYGLALVLQAKFSLFFLIHIFFWLLIPLYMC
jgi:hypothetical protein